MNIFTLLRHRRTALLTPKLATILASLLVASSLAAQPSTLTKSEQQLIEGIAAHKADAVDLLRRSVNLNSGSLNLPGVREVGKLFSAEFEDLGFEVRWSEMAEIGRAGHVIAKRLAKNNNPVRVLMIGHLDTVFEPDSPFQTFQFVDENGAPSDKPTRYAKGPGTTDMKGGNVIMLEVIRVLKDAGDLDNLEITVVLIGDEERSGKPHSIGRRDLKEAAKGVHFALGFEDGDDNPKTAVISRRGVASWSLEVTGTAAHSSQIFKPENGVGAIFETSRILNAFYEELSTIPNLTFNPGTILGGTEVDFDKSAARGSAYGKDNIIAERTIVRGDLRALSPQQYEDAKAKMEAIVAQSLPQTSATITFNAGYPSMAPTDGNRELLSMLSQASVDLGLGPVEAVNPRNAGAADISFVANLVASAIDGLGLMGTGGHTVTETADLDTLVTQAQKVALLLHRIAAKTARTAETLSKP